MVCSCIFNQSRHFGPVLWNLLHNIPRKLQQPNNMQLAINFIINAYVILPCHDCQTHAHSYLMTHPIVLSNPCNIIITKYELSKYLFDFHNAVNLRLQKPILLSHDIYYLQSIPPVNWQSINLIYSNAHNKKFFSQFLDQNQKNFLQNMIALYQAI